MLDEIDRKDAAVLDVAALTAAERPDVFQPQVQTLAGSAMAHRTREVEERPISPASEVRVARYRLAVLHQLPPNAC